MKTAITGLLWLLASSSVLAVSIDQCLTSVSCCFAGATIAETVLDGVSYASSSSSFAFPEPMDGKLAHFTIRAESHVGDKRTLIVQCASTLAHSNWNTLQFSSWAWKDDDNTSIITTLQSRKISSSSVIMPDCKLPSTAITLAITLPPYAAVGNNSQWTLSTKVRSLYKPECINERLEIAHSPSISPSQAPSPMPTMLPTLHMPPTKAPLTSNYPTRSPRTSFPTKSPKTSFPSKTPTYYPTKRPSTLFPTKFSTQRPTSMYPTRSPTLKPTQRDVAVALPSMKNVASTPQFLFTCTVGEDGCNLALTGRCGMSTKVVVYLFTAPANDTFVFSTDSALTSCADTTLQLFPQVICNDDISPNNAKSRITAKLIAGETYTLFVGSYNDECAAGKRVALSVSIATTRPTMAPSTMRPSRLPTAPTTRAPTRKGLTYKPTKQPSVSPTVTPFTIRLLFTDETKVTDTIRAAFEHASARWTQVIAQASHSFVIVEAGEQCGHVFPSASKVEDLLIIVKLSYIDGLYNVLGSAGPCVTDEFGHTRVGSMTFDMLDVEWLVKTNALVNTVMHEMGHVLGLGTLWGDLVGHQQIATSGGFEYLGEHGNTGDLLVGGTGQAIVEDGSWVGTSRVHWKESIYDTEIMTGFTNPDMHMPLSKLTVSALKDLGYVVNMDMADEYVIPKQHQGRALRTKDVALVGCVHHHAMQTVRSYAKPGKEHLHARALLHATGEERFDT